MQLSVLLFFKRLNLSELCRNGGVLFIVVFAEEEDDRLAGGNDSVCLCGVHVVVNGQNIDVCLCGGV